MNLREDDMVTVLKEVNDVPVSHTHIVAKSEMKLNFFSVQAYALFTLPLDSHIFSYSSLLKERELIRYESSSINLHSPMNVRDGKLEAELL